MMHCPSRVTCRVAARAATTGSVKIRVNVQDVPDGMSVDFGGMSKNEAIIRSGYAAAEGGVNDITTFVSLFTPDGVILDVASGTEYRGKASPTLTWWRQPQVRSICPRVRGLATGRAVRRA